jgi:FlaA1/EpsC-like NDP-sugar epimerase
MKLRFDPYSRTNQVIVDGTIFACSFAAAYIVRFEGVPPWAFCKQFLIWLPYLCALRLVVNWKFGVYKFIWRYVSLFDGLVIVRSLLVPTLSLLALRLLYPPKAIYGNVLLLPVSVIALDYLIALFGTLGARVLRRTLYERGQKKERSVVLDRQEKRVLLYGAGRAGVLLLNELKNQAEVRVVGFVDDDKDKIGMVVSGASVLGNRNSLEEIVHRLNVDEVVVSIARVERKTLGQILNTCSAVPVPVKIIPSLQELFHGHVNISQVRQLKIEDLLGRGSEVAEFNEDVRQAYSGKRILVTGAGGSIGSELVRQLLSLAPASIAILDKDENSTYELQQELMFRFPDAIIEPWIADVRNTVRLAAAFEQIKPQVVFHAAAHKHVPLMEKHPCEAVLNNVHGTRAMLDACCQHKVEQFVFISTDKAVNPTSVMGATKGVGELLVRTYAHSGPLRSSCVRFGNVMGSRGSVIPLFQKQIAEGGPITVTHPDVVRFFMTIPEAVQLVLCAGSLGNQGEVFVLDMGNPRNILDLASEMAKLSGLEPGKDIEIEITGLRPGEKLFEELTTPSESLSPTRYEKVSKIIATTTNGHNSELVIEKVNWLVNAAQENDPQKIREVLSSLGLGIRQNPGNGSMVESPKVEMKGTSN